jgi:L-malate glycosyltransferase
MTNQKHLLHVFSTFGVGGPEVRSCDLINHFGDRYRHTILAMDDNYDCQSKLDPKAPVEFHRVTNDKSSLKNNLRNFSQLLKKINPDLLLTYNFGSIEWGAANAWVNQAPHFHWEEGFGPEEVKQQFRRRILIRKLFLVRTKKIVVVSHLLENIALQQWKFPKRKIENFPNGVDMQKYSRPQRTASTLPVVIGTVAKLRPEKNISRLIRCFSKVADEGNARLIIIGSGPEENSLKELVKQLKIAPHVEFTGYVNDPSEMVKSFDILAISSDTEQMPISVLEGMAAGCPIVGTDVGDIRVMVSESNQKYLSPVTDEEKFTHDLQSLILSSTLRNSIGQENLKRCARLYAKEVMFEKYQNLYDSVLF